MFASAAPARRKPPAPQPKTPIRATKASWREKAAMSSYGGYVPASAVPEPEPVKRKEAILGYRGHVRGGGDAIGTTFTASRAAAADALANPVPGMPGRRRPRPPQSPRAAEPVGGLSTADLYDRYQQAIELAGGQPAVDRLLESMLRSLEQHSASTFRRSRRVRLAFEELDTDNSGTLELQEFREALNMLNCIVSEDDALALFGSFDADCNGTIGWEEFASRLGMS